MRRIRTKISAKRSAAWRFSSTLLSADASSSFKSMPAQKSLPAPRTVTTRTAASRSAWSSRVRSEEHTSELQSHSDLVCRLLLEKKKKKTINNHTDSNRQHNTYN